MSWRDTTPEPVQHDLDTLLTQSFEMLENLFKEFPEILPFGLQTETTGDAGLLVGDPEFNATSPAPATVLAQIEETLRQRKDELRAVLTVAPVEVAGRDAVAVQFEHRDGGPGLLLLRLYTQTPTGRAVRWGDSQAQIVDKRVW